MLMPFMRAASNTLVPAGTRTGWPSIVMSTRPGGVAAVVISGADSNALGFSGPRSGCEADSAGALSAQNVHVDFRAKMFQDGLNRSGQDLTEAADRSEAHGLREFVKERELVAIKTHGVQSHVQHARRIVANDNRAGTEHGTSFSECFEIKPHVAHRSRKIARRRTGRCEGFQLASPANAARVTKNDIAHGRAHGNLEYAGASHVAANTDKLQSTGAASTLRGEPIHAPRENLRHIDESFDVIEHRRLLPETSLHWKRRLVARLRAMTLNRLHQRGFFAANVAARADKNFEIEIKLAPEDLFSEEARATAAANLFAKDFFLEMILVPNVENAELRAGNNAGDEHALDEEMRQMRHDEAVFDRAGLAFIGVADDILDGVAFLADEIPLHARGESGAAHAAKFRSFKLSEDIVEGAGLHELANDAVFFVIAVRIGFAFHARRLRM